MGLHRLAHASRLTNLSDGPRLALIIDDIGFSRSMAQRFLEIKIPLTFSILPRLPLSSHLAESIHTHGHEIMLHQPMEPLQSDIDPGPGALYVRDSPNRIVQTVAQNIYELPFAAGINNHMGSRFTQDSRKMMHALALLRRQKLFFIDSLTTRRSKAFSTARRLKVPSLRRDLFVDPIACAETTYRQLCRLKRCALVHGSAIGIGHPHRETAEGLRLFIKKNAHQGIELTYVSRLMNA